MAQEPGVDKADSDCGCPSPVSGHQTALLMPRQTAMISGCLARGAFFARSEHEVRSANGSQWLGAWWWSVLLEM